MLNFWGERIFLALGVCGVLHIHLSGMKISKQAEYNVGVVDYTQFGTSLSPATTCYHNYTSKITFMSSLKLR
jgi:hypothetical protein